MMRSIAVFAAMLAPVLAQAAPRLVFTKSFPGSTPPYVEISVEKDGSVIYKEAPDDNNPISIHLQQADADAMFSLADKLNQFADPLEANIKVAFMGKKTFRYEDPAGTVKHQAEFNYSADLNAQALLDWFERIAESERDFIELERSVKYDKLGVQNALLQIQATQDQKRLVAPEQFLSLLDRVVKNASYMNIARERAALFAKDVRAQQQAPAAVATQK
ncbi:MAG TPA: hypothetical protein VGM43_10845 [Bryobacteraceae bacterium]|jgi:hypothetical protein